MEPLLLSSNALTLPSLPLLHCAVLAPTDDPLALLAAVEAAGARNLDDFLFVTSLVSFSELLMPLRSNMC